MPSGIVFLRQQKQYRMYDEAPKFSDKLWIILTTNAVSKNQAG
ncbi:hypothetical protein [Nostoc flagelliforme]|nr:hypothetical protein [Nostoc flagelliforme]